MLKIFLFALQSQKLTVPDSQADPRKLARPGQYLTQVIRWPAHFGALNGAEIWNFNTFDKKHIIIFT